MIISHIPPGSSDCLYEWAIRYNAILDRFQHIVRFSVYGHVHIESFGTIRGFNDSLPIGTHIWTGSVSTWVQVNPSFRMIVVDEQTMLPVKINTYSMNIRDANPEWKYDHELTEFYNMTDLSPASYDLLSTRFLTDE